MANIQITDKLFHTLVKYFLAGVRSDDIETYICDELTAKMEKMVAHDKYTKTLSCQPKTARYEP